MIYNPFTCLGLRLDDVAQPLSLDAIFKLEASSQLLQLQEAQVPKVLCALGTKLLRQKDVAGHATDAGCDVSHRWVVLLDAVSFFEQPHGGAHARPHAPVRNDGVCSVTMRVLMTALKFLI